MKDFTYKQWKKIVEKLNEETWTETEAVKPLKIGLRHVKRKVSQEKLQVLKPKSTVLIFKEQK